MKKRIHPKDQTQILNNAQLQFLLRNKEAIQRLQELVGQDGKRRDEITTALATIGGKVDPERKEKWDFFYEHSENPVGEGLAEFVKKAEIPKAVNAVWRWVDYSMEIERQRLVLPTEPGVSNNLGYEELKTKIIDLYCRDARDIFSELMNGRPSAHLLMGVDLTRNKEVILEEVKRVILEYQKKLGVHEVPEKRFKWLSMVDELLEVWDLYDHAGQRPWKETFKRISEKVGRPLSTVKDQWRTAYEKIYGQPYDANSKFATEEKRGDADQLCAKCPHGAICYKKGGDWVPCRDYLKVAGREKTRKAVSYRDDLQYSENGKTRKKTPDKR
jgi:hypothetical protein